MLGDNDLDKNGHTNMSLRDIEFKVPVIQTMHFKEILRTSRIIFQSIFGSERS